jgi:Tfp pilus assembly protein PilO
MEIKDRQKFLVILTVAGLALLAGNSVILNPLLKGWDDRSKEISSLKLKVAQAKQLISQKTRLERRWQEMQTNTLPSDQTVAGSIMLQAVYRWGQDSGMSIDQFTPQLKTEEDADTKNVITTIDCRTDASGSMRSMLRFLWNVEKDPLGLKVEDMVISSRDNNGQQLSLGLQLSGLVLEPPAPPSNPQASQPATTQKP